MKAIQRLIALLFCCALILPTATFAQENDAPEGYLPAQGEKAAPRDASAPEGYLPAGSNPASKDSAPQADGFVPAEKSSAETVDGGRLMLLAYAGFWLIALGYIATLAQRARRTGKDVVELHRRLQELDDRIEDLETRGRA